ncbi:hypothetical protein QFC22_001967 [Naganishia vaughanmartiniae]|uniref:Uncharacterized protein n=1 Tax=Naganishia vaughanmartiniae TaxID=1424756 RepID=A0ACC2XFZ9_9TREE|nr:hypothetical protein QFC22_001967 [Naganishia vaughanmartiniae]
MAVLITAFSSLLAAATPLSARQFSPKAFQCVEGDSTGTMFYNGDGSPSQCAPGTVCRFVPGQTWSPCCVAPDATGVSTGPEIPDKSSEAPGGGSTILPLAPTDTTSTPPAEYPGVTETPKDEDEENCCEEDEGGDDTSYINDGIDLGAVDIPSPAPSASASTSDLLATQLKLATNSPPVQGLLAAESSTGVAASANSTTLAPPSSAGRKSAATVSLSDPGADGYATFHPGESTHGTACGDTFGAHADQEPFYVAISPKLW